MIQQKTVLPDKYKRKIYALLKANPQGLGFNELWKLSGFTKNTLEKRRNELKDKGFIKTERRGQKVVHKITEAWALYNQKLEKLESYGTMLLVRLLMFKHRLSKEKAPQEKIDEWLQGFMYALTQTYFFASIFCANYTDRLKGTFFYTAHNIMKHRFIELSHIMRSYLPEQRIIPNPKILLPGWGEGTSKEEFLAWVKDTERPETKMYKRIEKMVLEDFTLHEGTLLK